MQTAGIHFRTSKNRTDMQEWLQAKATHTPIRFYLVDEVRRLDNGNPIFKVMWHSFDIVECYDALHTLYGSDERLEILGSAEAFELDDEIHSGENFIYFVGTRSRFS